MELNRIGIGTMQGSLEIIGVTSGLLNAGSDVKVFVLLCVCVLQPVRCNIRISGIRFLLSNS